VGMFWNRVFVGGIWWAGRAKSINVPNCICWEGANDEQRAARTCHTDTRHSPCFVCSAINSIKSVAFAAHLTALRCTALR